jgi:hypothetical protein
VGGKGEAFYEGSVEVPVGAHSAKLALNRIKPVPVRIVLAGEAQPDGMRNANFVLYYLRGENERSKYRMETGADGACTCWLRPEGTYRLSYPLTRRVRSIQSKPFVPGELDDGRIELRIPPLESLVFRVRFVIEDDGEKRPANSLGAIEVFHRDRSAMFPVRKGVLCLDIMEGEALNAFRVGETFRLSFEQDFRRHYKVPKSSAEYAIGKANEGPLEIVLVPQRRAEVAFDVKTEGGRRLRHPQIALRREGAERWKVGATDRTLEHGRYDVLVWQYGYSLLERSVTIPGEAGTPFVLKRADRARVSLVDTEGKPIPGATRERVGATIKLRYHTDGPLPPRRRLCFPNKDGITELYWDAAFRALVVAAVPNGGRVVTALKASRHDYEVRLPNNTAPITVTLDAGKYEALLKDVDEMSVCWAVTEPFRCRLTMSDVSDALSTVRLVPGVYQPYVELGRLGSKIHPDFWDKVLVFARVDVTDEAKTIRLEARELVDQDAWRD